MRARDIKVDTNNCEMMCKKSKRIENCGKCPFKAEIRMRILLSLKGRRK